MNKKWLLTMTLLLVLFWSAASNSWKELDLGSFKISIPKQWSYKKEQGEDSFVGGIIGPNVAIKFDFSNQGYAGNLITTPVEMKAYNIQIDTTEKYIIKTVWPKTPAKGITGIYFKGKYSGLTFNMLGINLSKQNQLLALKAFKTIVIK